jgi:hypothetical protein
MKNLYAKRALIFERQPKPPSSRVGFSCICWCQVSRLPEPIREVGQFRAKAVLVRGSLKGMVPGGGLPKASRFNDLGQRGTRNLSISFHSFPNVSVPPLPIRAQKDVPFQRRTGRATEELSRPLLTQSRNSVIGAGCPRMSQSELDDLVHSRSGSLNLPLSQA